MSYIRSLISLTAIFGGVAALGACSTPAHDEGVGTADQALEECNATGTWAIKITTPVQWPATFVLQAGTGTVSNWLRSNRVQDGTQVVDTAKICAVEIADYQATATFGSEKYGIRFASSTFDAETMPAFTLAATLTSKEVGATFTSPAAAALLGATMTDPVNDPWPANVAQLVATDADGDGKPGISADSATGQGMSNPPVNAFRTVRANRVYTAFRQVMSASGTVKSCTRSEGSGEIAVINNKPAIDAHVVGCRRENGTDCNASEFKLLDSAQPVYTPTGKAIVTMVKIPDTATCDEIRAMDFADGTDGGSD